MKYKKGSYYQVQFFDHVSGVHEALLCEVCAKVIDEDEHCLYLSWWNIIDQDDTTTMNNREDFTVVKSTVKQAYLIED